ncbi:hypothetical protein, partial [Photorhabdus sp. RW14-46]|uniref:hypothetical protein n=1 Tax=Photorhabdus sp. RW14-46 TaxID=2100168 RepID=UPI001A996DED
HIFSGKSLPNALIEEPKESNIRKGKTRKYYIYNNYFMKAIHLNQFLTCIRIITTILSKHRLLIFFPIINSSNVENNQIINLNKEIE